MGQEGRYVVYLSMYVYIYTHGQLLYIYIPVQAREPDGLKERVEYTVYEIRLAFVDYTRAVASINNFDCPPRKRVCRRTLFTRKSAADTRLDLSLYI